MDTDNFECPFEIEVEHPANLQQLKIINRFQLIKLNEFPVNNALNSFVRNNSRSPSLIYFLHVLFYCININYANIHARHHANDMFHRNPLMCRLTMH